MKQKIVESISIEEAFKALNQQSAKKKNISKSLNESATNSIIDHLVDITSEFILDNLTEQELSDFGIEVMNPFTAPEYFCIDTGSAQQVVFAIDTETGNIFVEEDTDNVGIEVEYSSADEFVDDYLSLIGINESLNESADALPKVPAPYNNYFEVLTEDELEDLGVLGDEGMFQIGEEVDGVKILAYLAPKDGYEDIFDSWYFLTDNDALPVVEIGGQESIFAVDLDNYLDA